MVRCWALWIGGERNYCVDYHWEKQFLPQFTFLLCNKEVPISFSVHQSSQYAASVWSIHRWVTVTLLMILPPLCSGNPSVDLPGIFFSAIFRIIYPLTCSGTSTYDLSPTSPSSLSYDPPVARFSHFVEWFTCKWVPVTFTMISPTKQFDCTST